MHRSRKILLAAVLGSGVVLTPVALSAFAASPYASSASQPAGGRFLAFLASVEGVSPTVLRQEQKAGKTLLQIAGNRYSSANDLATALLRPIKARLDRAPSHGGPSASQENTIYTRLHTRLARLVGTPMPRLGGMFRGRVTIGRMARARGGTIQALATACKTTLAALRKAFEAGGKTPLAICQATNSAVTQQSLVTAIMTSFKARLATVAGRMGLTAEQQNRVLSHIQMRVTRWVTSQIPTDGVHPF